jgi:mitochondrial fusion and transport protein UGO1
VQSAHPRYATYTGPIDALRQIVRDEGGVRSLYLHPHLLIPTVLDSALTSVIALALPGLLARSLGAAHVSPDTHPFTWGLAEFAGSCVGLLAALPFETIRRRLQVQTRGNARALRTCVETRPIPYNGVVDAAWRIVTEERSDLPLNRRRRRRHSSASKAKASQETDGEESADEHETDSESWLKHTGVGQLYRGLGMRLGASAIVFLLAMVAELGWTEL